MRFKVKKKFNKSYISTEKFHPFFGLSMLILTIRQKWQKTLIFLLTKIEKYDIILR